MPLHDVDGLEIDQDLDFQRKEWRAQRIGWAIMFLIIVAALTGALGKGPLARTQATASDGSFTLHYDRIVRHYAGNRFEFAITRAGQDTIGIWFDNAFLAGLELRDILPQPVRSAAVPGSTIFYFAVQPGARITFTYEPDKFGRRRGRVGIEHGASLQLRQFVLP